MVRREILGIHTGERALNNYDEDRLLLSYYDVFISLYFVLENLKLLKIS